MKADSRITQTLEVDGKRYVPAARVRERYDISTTAFWRLQRTPEFPCVVQINGKNYIAEDEIEAWARDQVARSLKAAKALKKAA